MGVPAARRSPSEQPSMKLKNNYRNHNEIENDHNKMQSLVVQA